MSTSNPDRQLPGILLIDDDAISREVFAMMLGMHGFPVDSAEDGRQALDHLDHLDQAATLPGVILMDTQMPGVSGVRLIKALRQRIKTAGATTRIVAISGSEVDGSILRAADGFLLKPIQVESLLELLNASSNAAEEPGPAIGAPATPEASTHSNTAAISDAAFLDQASDAAGIVPAIDPIVLAKFHGMMPASAVREVYAAVASDLETRLTTLIAAIDNGDAVEVARIAHTIKGGCGMVGLTIATEAAARLEASTRRETWPNDLLQLHFALDKLQHILGNGLL
jgi:CheY-like chemotaxis protein